MRYLHNQFGFSAYSAEGRIVCHIICKTPAVPAAPPAMGVPARPAMPEQIRPASTWAFEFVGRPITSAELDDLVSTLQAAATMADAERDKEKAAAKHG